MMQAKLSNLAAVLRYEADHAKACKLEAVSFSIGTLHSIADKLDEAVGQWRASMAVQPKPTAVEGLSDNQHAGNGALYVAVAADLFGVAHEDLIGPRRLLPISTARAVLIYVLHEYGHGPTEIGGMIQKSPPTCIQAVARVKAALANDRVQQIGSTTQTMAHAVAAYKEALEKYEVTA